MRKKSNHTTFFKVKRKPKKTIQSDIRAAFGGNKGKLTRIGAWKRKGAPRSFLEEAL